MDLSTWAAASRGRQAWLARQLERTEAQVSQWCAAPGSTNWRQVPADMCPAIERETGGEVPCEELRPDLTWRRVEDRAWKWCRRGKPLLDLTVPA